MVSRKEMQSTRMTTLARGARLLLDAGLLMIDWPRNGANMPKGIRAFETGAQTNVQGTDCDRPTAAPSEC